MQKDFSTIAPDANQNGKMASRSNAYREQVIAEIISSGHAAEKNNDDFRAQVKTWSVCLSIATDELLLYFIKVKRSRIAIRSSPARNDRVG